MCRGVEMLIVVFGLLKLLCCVRGEGLTGDGGDGVRDRSGDILINCHVLRKNKLANHVEQRLDAYIAR